MSRDIKFRARLVKREGNRTKGQWVYGLPQQRVEIHGVVNLNKPAEIGYIVSYEPERMLQSGAPDNNLYWYEIDPETLGQYTGLKDKNCVEIYEGDIVTSHTPFDHWADKLSVVKYEGGTWNYSYALQEFSDTPEKQWEVIGNIYETPKLLSTEP